MINGNHQWNISEGGMWQSRFSQRGKVHQPGRLCILSCPSCCRHPTRLECAQSTVESCCRPSTTRTWMTGYTPSILSWLAQFGERHLLLSGLTGGCSEQEEMGWSQILVLRSLTRRGNWRREESRRKNPQNNQKTSQPCISGTVGAVVLACDALNSHVQFEHVWDAAFGDHKMVSFCHFTNVPENWKKKKNKNRWINFGEGGKKTFRIHQLLFHFSFIQVETGSKTHGPDEVLSPCNVLICSPHSPSHR